MNYVFGPQNGCSFLTFKSVRSYILEKEIQLSQIQMKDKNENIYELTTVTSEKDLGMTFQHDMKFDIHINNIVNKANRLLGLVKKPFLIWIETHS